MKKNIWLTFLISFIPILLLAQPQEMLPYQVSKPYKVINGEKHYLSSPNSTKTLLVKRHQKAIYLQSFDTQTMTELSRTKFDDLPKGYLLENISWVGSKLYCFFSVWDKSNFTQRLFSREIDFERATFSAKEKEIIAVKSRVTDRIFSSEKHAKLKLGFRFSFTPSFDHKKLLIQYRKKPLKARDAINYDVIGLYVFGQEMELLNGNEITMPYTEKKMKVLDYQINAKGIPFVLARKTNDNSFRKTKVINRKTVANYSIELLKIDLQSNQVFAYPVSFKDYLIKDIRLRSTRQNELLIIGFYYDKTELNYQAEYGTDLDIKNNNSDGFFITKVDSEGNTIFNKFHLIPIEILNLYTKKEYYASSEAKSKRAFSSLEIRDILIKENGNIFIAAEQFTTSSHHDYYDYYGYYHTSSIYNHSYHYNDILTCKIKPDGEIDWMRKLPKRQVNYNLFSVKHKGRESLGFKHFSINGYQYFVFLDHRRNINLSVDKKPYSYINGKSGLLTVYKVEEATGKVTKVSVLNTKKIKTGQKLYQFNTARVLPLANSEEFIIEFYKKRKEDIMVKVKLK